MPNGTYGGVRGRKTKVGRKLLRFPPTRLLTTFFYRTAKKRNRVQDSLRGICGRNEERPLGCCVFLWQPGG